MENPWKLPKLSDGSFVSKKEVIKANLDHFAKEANAGANLKELFADLESWLLAQAWEEKLPYSTVMRNVKKRREELEENAPLETPQVNQEENKQTPLEVLLANKQGEIQISTKTSRVGKVKKVLRSFDPLKRSKTPQSNIVDMDTAKEQERLLKAEFEAMNAGLEIKLSYELFKRGYRISWWEWKKRGGGRTTAKEREKICTGLEVQRLYEPHNCCVGDPDWNWTKNLFAQNPYLEPVV